MPKPKSLRRYNRRMSSPATPAHAATTSPAKPSLIKLLLIWLKIGATSFGGGSATQLLIQQEFVTKRQWMTPEAFAQDWAIVQFTPGINLIALTVLIGRRFGGVPGIVASVFGMLAPAVAITIAMTALYARVRDLPEVSAALRGITPALVGLSLAFMWRLLKGPVQGMQQISPLAVVVGFALVLATAALTALGVPVLISYLVGAVGLGLVYGLAPCKSVASF